MLPFFFFKETATTEIYTLSLHDALPISRRGNRTALRQRSSHGDHHKLGSRQRSEEHTSELQSRVDLVCRLLLEKKKQRPVQVPVPLRQLGREVLAAEHDLEDTGPYHEAP